MLLESILILRNASKETTFADKSTVEFLPEFFREDFAEFLPPALL